MNKLKNTFRTSLIALVSIAIVAGVTHAGSLTPSNTPPNTNFNTLSDIYNKLTDFSFTPSTHSISTTTAPAQTQHTLSEIYALLENENANIVPSKIVTGTTIFGVAGTANPSASELTWQGGSIANTLLE